MTLPGAGLPSTIGSVPFRPPQLVARRVRIPAATVAFGAVDASILLSVTVVDLARHEPDGW